MNNLENRIIVLNGDFANFMGYEEGSELYPLEFMSELWARLYQSGAVRNPDGTRARRRRKRERESAKRRRTLAAR